jgi:hypothetical protein
MKIDLIRAIRNLSLFILTLAILFSLISPKPAYAASFTLDPSARTAAPSETFSVDIKIDTEGENATSADVLLNFNSAILSISSITPGSFFPQNFKTSSASQVYVGGAVQNATENRTGAGILATINFSAVGSGVSTLEFDCTPGKTSDSNITKDDKNATDILDCTSLTNGSYTISGNLTGTQATPTPKTLPRAGNARNTIIFVGIGVILTIIGIMVML